MLEKANIDDCNASKTKDDLFIHGCSSINNQWRNGFSLLFRINIEQRRGKYQASCKNEIAYWHWDSECDHIVIEWSAK